jgi:glycosyltransferase involved in cell wall biosynthesis
MHVIQVSKRFVSHSHTQRQSFFCRTAALLNEQGVNTSVFTTAAEGMNIPEYVNEVSAVYPIMGLSAQRREQLAMDGGDPYSFGLLRALKHADAADVIHLEGGKRLGAFVRAAARKRRIPYVVSLTGEFFVFFHPRTGIVHAPAEQRSEGLDVGRVLDLTYSAHRVLEDAAALICSRRDDFTAASRTYPDKPVVYLPEGVDMNRFSNGSPAWFRKLYRIPEQRFMILCVDSIEQKNNQLTLIRQLPDVLEQAAEVHLVLIGTVADEQYHDKLLKEISLQKLHSRVTIIPGLPYESQDMINAYKAADAYIHPSLYDGTGTAVLEAWAAGLPVAAAKRGAPRFFIEHNVSGLLFDPEAPARFSESMKNSMIALAANSENRARYASRGQQTVSREYSWEVITARLRQLYEGVVSDS